MPCFPHRRSSGYLPTVKTRSGWFCRSRRWTTDWTHSCRCTAQTRWRPRIPPANDKQASCIKLVKSEQTYFPSSCRFPGCVWRRQQLRSRRVRWRSVWKSICWKSNRRPVKRYRLLFITACFIDLGLFLVDGGIWFLTYCLLKILSVCVWNYLTPSSKKTFRKSLSPKVWKHNYHNSIPILHTTT